VVPALLDQGKAAVRGGPREVAGPPTQRLEPRLRHDVPPQGVDRPGVAARADDEQVRIVLFDDGGDDPVERLQIPPVARPRRERDVHVVPLARARAVFLDLARLGVSVGIPRPVVVVDADGEHVRAVVEDRLGAVAVVDVPVDDGDAVDGPVGQRRLDGDRRVVEKTEAVDLCRLGVVAAWPNERVRDVHEAARDGVVGGRRRRARGVSCRAVRRLVRPGRPDDAPAAGLA